MVPHSSVTDETAVIPSGVENSKLQESESESETTNQTERIESETNSTTDDEWGWSEAYAPDDPDQPKPQGREIKIDPKICFYVFVPIGVLFLILILIKKRVPQKIFTRLFRKKAALTDQEIILKELYQKRLEAEKEILLKDRKNRKGTNVPTKKED